MWNVQVQKIIFENQDTKVLNSTPYLVPYFEAPLDFLSAGWLEAELGSR